MKQEFTYPCLELQKNLNKLGSLLQNVVNMNDNPILKPKIRETFDPKLNKLYKEIQMLKQKLEKIRQEADELNANYKKNGSLIKNGVTICEKMGIPFLRVGKKKKKNN